MEPTPTFSTPPAPQNSPSTPPPPPRAPTRIAAHPPKRGKLFYIGIAGIVSGGLCCILSLVSFILSATLKAAPAATVLPAKNPTATSLLTLTPLPATSTSLPESTLTPTTQSPGASATTFSDDFSNTNGGWYLGSTNDYEASYIQDGYTMGIKTPKYYFVSILPDPFPDPIGNIVINVRGKIALGDTGEFGVVCRYQDIDNFYLAAVSGDSFYIGKQVNGTWTYLTDPHLQPLPDRTPDQDGYLSIGFSCIDSFIVLEVNGIGAAHVTDEGLSEGNVGLYVYGASQIGQSGYYTEGYFDDFSARLP